MAGEIGLLLSDDLIFSSRVTATARSLGLTVKVARSTATLEAMAQAEPPRCVIVDLANPGLDVAALTKRLAELCPVVPRIVAYGSHVDTAGLRQGREAGCEPVLPRSKFVEDLPLALPTWMAAGPNPQYNS